jgi:hypothetical protein
MNRYDLTVLSASALIVMASVSLVVWPPHGWARGDAAGVTQAVSSVVAVSAALLIAARDRREAERGAAEDRRAEHAAYARRRDCEEAARLLTIVEADRRASFGSDGPVRSIEGTALVLSAWAKRNLWGTAVDYYVQAVRDPESHFRRVGVTDADFRRMQDEIVAALDGFDHGDRTL